MFPVYYTKQTQGAAGAQSMVQPFRINTQDGNGNGFLVASDQIFITFGNNQGATASEAQARIGYRFTATTLEDYLGILASQM